jgi:intein-encoded DNA endonuclease-like protein
MARTSTYPLHDRALGGKLTELLTGLRSSGMSYEDITYTLRSEHGMTVTRSTVRRWCIDLGLAS